MQASRIGMIAAGAAALLAVTQAGSRVRVPVAPPVEEALPEGPHVDTVRANCVGCHSAGMILTQPALTADQWRAIVVKMRDVFRAPIAGTDDAAIVAYLAMLTAVTTH